MASPLVPDPPPWSSLVHHFTVAAYIYLALLVFAFTLVFLHRRRMIVHASRWYLLYSHNLNGLPLRIFANITDLYARYGFVLALARMFFSTAICVIYVCITYLAHIPTPLIIFNRTIAVVLLFHLVLNLIFAVRPIRFVRSAETIMEVISLVSLLTASSSDWLNFSFLQAYIILSRYFTVEPIMEAVFALKSSPVRRQLTHLTWEFVVFIYVFACGLQLFERLGEPTNSLSATTFELTLANSFYFTVVTIFTVGYGDFVPYTFMGRLWVLLIIIFGAYLVSRKISQVVEVVSGLRRGLGAFVKAEGVKHCVICGNVKWEYLKSFVQEFYGDERNMGKKLVVICDHPNWTEETWNKFFAAHATFQNNVSYLEGSCVHRDDLLRAQVETASAVFVLNNQHNPDPYAEDSETLKRILTIRSYMPSLPIYSMCALKDSMLQISYALEHRSYGDENDGPSRKTSISTGIASYAESIQPGRDIEEQFYAELGGDLSDVEEEEDGIHISGDDDKGADLKSEAICMQEVEMALLAENVFCNGLSTLLANLILRVNPVSKASDQPWAVEYKIGSECCFEYVKLPLPLHRRKVSDIALIMYDFGVLLIATKRYMDNKWKAVTPDTEIQLSMFGLIITYHSPQFLEVIMKHIANCVHDMYQESSSKASSQDVPSPEANSPPYRDVPHHRIAGDKLTGEFYAYQPPPESKLSSSYPESSFPLKTSRSMPDTSSPTPITATVGRMGSDALDNAPPQSQQLQVAPADKPAIHEIASLGTTSPLARPLIITRADQERAQLSRIEVSGSAPSLAAASDQPQKHVSPPPPPPVVPSHVGGEDLLSSTKRLDGAGPSGLQRLPGFFESDEEVDDADFGVISRPARRESPVKESPLEASLKRSSEALVDTTDTSQNHMRQVPLHVDLPRKEEVEREGSPRNAGNALNVNQKRASDSPSGEDQNLPGIGLSVGHGDRDAKLPVDATSPGEEDDAEESSDSKDDLEATAEDTASAAEGNMPQKRRHHVSFPNQSADDAQKQKGGLGDKRTRGARIAQSEVGVADDDGGLKVYHGDDELPIKVKGHVVVCTIGHMGVLNLKHFLHRVWTKRGYNSRSDFDGRTPVVAICPALTEDEEAELSGFDPKRLFVIQGNSLSLKTLRMAQYDQAKAIVILACEDKNDVDHMDAKAIFTVMTLDHLLGEKSTTFVCTMLDAEESMQLLRAPRHPRRQSVRLPIPGNDYMIEFGIAPDSLHGVSRNSLTGYVNSQAATYRLLQGGRSSTSLRARTMSMSVNRFPVSMSFIGRNSARYTDRREAISRMVGIRDPSVMRSARMRSTTSFADFQQDPGQTDDQVAKNPSAEDRSSALDFLINPSTLTFAPVLDAGTDTKGLFNGNIGYGNANRYVETGIAGTAHQGARDESFEKQRYASGEMMISSTYLALLIREYSMPGLMSVVRKIFGTGINRGASSKPCWIRTINVPQKWILQSPSGQRTYRELFEALIKHGAVALGLYRSGNVMVRIQVEADSDLIDDDASLSQYSFDGPEDSTTDEAFDGDYGLYGEDIAGSAFDIGGDSVLRSPHSQIYEHSSLLHDLPNYGSMHGTSQELADATSASRSADGLAAEADDGTAERADISPNMMFEVFEGMKAVQYGDLDGSDNLDQAEYKVYRCPTHGRETIYEERPGGENVLPYVYTNPEAYTLVSEHDAVYVLVAPSVQLPDADDW